MSGASLRCSALFLTTSLLITDVRQPDGARVDISIADCRIAALTQYLEKSNNAQETRGDYILQLDIEFGR